MQCIVMKINDNTRSSEEGRQLERRKDSRKRMRNQIKDVKNNKSDKQGIVRDK